MTVIAGVVHKGKVYIAGDSAGVAGHKLTKRADAKVWSTDMYAYGFTYSFRMGQLLRYSFKAPEPDTRDVHRFMATTWIDALRDCLKEGGWSRKTSEQEEGGTFLVGVAGRLFTVESDYQVGESLNGYAAVGAGEDIALGALHATAELRPRERLTRALAAAEHHSTVVVGPYVYATARGAS